MSYAPPPPGQPFQPPGMQPGMPPAMAKQAPGDKPHMLAWLVPLAALLAVIGLFTPWFSPQGTFHGQAVLHAEGDLYSWKDGRIGLVAPIALVIAAVAVMSLLRGKSVSRFEQSRHAPVVAAARSVMIVGAVSLVAVVIAWFLVPGQFDDVPADAGGSWDGAERMGIDMSRGPQLGYWLTVVAALLAIVAGVLMLALRDKSADNPPNAFVAPPPAPPQWQQGQYPPGPQGQYPQR